MPDVFAKGLRDRRRSLLVWGVCIAVLPLWLATLYPSVAKSSSSLQKLVDGLPQSFKTMFMGKSVDLASPVGYLDSKLMSLMSPLLLVVFAIGIAVAQIAGEEEDGTLGLLLAYPISRAAVLAQKLAVVVAAIVALTTVHFFAMWAGVALEHMRVGAGTLAAGHLSVGLFALSIGAVAFAIAAATGRRAAATGGATALAALAYLLNALAPLSQSTVWLQKLSLFHYAGGAQPLATGFDATNVIVLLAVTAIAIAIAFASFMRRDIRV